MEKNATIIDLQALYHGAYIRKHIEKNLIQEISKLRAIILIQRCWRWNLLKIRITLLKDIKMHCSKIKGNVLILEESLYVTLMKYTEEDIKQKSRIMEQMINFGFLNNKITAWYTLIPDKTHPRYFNANYVTPKWMSIPLPDLNEPPTHINELTGLIHSIFSVTESVSYHKIVDPKYKGIEIPLTFVKFICESQEEAQSRAFMIALKTFNYKKKECMRFYTPGMLKDPINCAQHIRMWNAFNIVDHSKTFEESLPPSSLETSEWPLIISHNPVPLLQLDCIKLRDSKVYSNAFGNIGTAADEIIDINDVFDQESMAAEEP